MLNKLKPKSEFSRNVLTLMTGTTVAQAIPIAISPILTRLYTPQDFGVFALFIAITSIFGSVANGRYELAIMLPKKDEDAIGIFILALFINGAIALLLFLILFFFNDKIIELFFEEGMEPKWLYVVPFAVFLVGLFNLSLYLHNRFKRYKTIAQTNVMKALVSTLIQIGYVVVTKGFWGLVLGHIGSYLIANIKLLLGLREVKFSFNKARIFFLAAEYKKFFFITVPHTVFSTFSQQFPIFILAKISSTQAGFYLLVMRVLATPLQIISTSYNQVYFEAFSKKKCKISFFKKKFLIFNGIALLLLVPSVFLLPELFTLFFGEAWRMAGEYAVILLPFIYLKFLTNIFAASVYVYFQYQMENFIIEVLFFTAMVIAFISGIVIHDDIKLFLTYISFLGSLIMAFKLLRSYVILTKKETC